MKRIAIVIALIAVSASAQSRHSRSSVEAEWFTSPSEASTFIVGNPRGAVLPVAMYPDLLSPPRISYLGIAPHINNGRDLVWATDAPPTSATTCAQVCNGTLTVCSVRSVSAPLVLRSFATLGERDAAWSQLSGLSQGYAAKLAYPIGGAVNYGLLVPTERTASPSWVCTP
jgi:hypothetical protein